MLSRRAELAQLLRLLLRLSRRVVGTLSRLSLRVVGTLSRLSVRVATLPCRTESGGGAAASLRQLPPLPSLRVGLL